ASGNEPSKSRAASGNERSEKGPLPDGRGSVQHRQVRLPANQSEVALLLSMTGFGEARHQDPRGAIQVEIRTVKNRHFKLSARISEEFSAMEGALEQLVRERVKRGTVQVTLRIDRPRRADDYRLNLVALASYRDQLRSVQADDALGRDS